MLVAHEFELRALGRLGAFEPTNGFGGLAELALRGFQLPLRHAQNLKRHDLGLL